MEHPTANRAQRNTVSTDSLVAPLLNSRRQALLEIIVSEYIETAVPVASQQLAKRYELRVSPATIRNDMAELEEMGYISRPHASAGGVPADPGYRFYVDRFVQRPRLPRHFEDQVRDAIQPGEADPAAWARNAAGVLSRAVQNLTIATTSRPSVARVKQLQLVQLHDYDALLVVVMQEAHIRQRMVRFDAAVTQENLSEAAARLNALISGKGAADLRALWDAGRVVDPVSEAVIIETIRVLADEEREESHERYTIGLRQMLNQPEFQEGHRAQNAADVIEDDSIDRLIAEPAEPTEVRVVIGEESHNEHLRPYSVVYATYGAPGDTRGVIGTLGPTRMDYSRAIASVRYLAAFLGELTRALEPSSP